MAEVSEHAKPELSSHERGTQATKSGGATKLSWRDGRKVPRAIVRSTDATVGMNGVVYLRHGGTQEMYAYDTVSDDWSRLPDCPTVGCSIAVIADDLLTTIGGYHDQQGYSNELFSFTAAGDGGCDTTEPASWTRRFPPMPTMRYGTTALYTSAENARLIVAGGWGERGALNTVEVMNVETEQWFSAAKLPMPTLGSSGAICGDHIYLHGGEVYKGHTKHLYTCSLSSLLQSCSPTSGLESNRGSEHPKDTRASTVTVWCRSNGRDLPAQISTCVSLNDRLLVVGGYDSGKPVTAIHCHSCDRSWEIISHMHSARCYSFAVVLGDSSRLVVAGGIVDGTPSDSVEIAAITVEP